MNADVAAVFSPTLAARTGRMTTSAVREILKVAERPDVLSFAGGLPAPELFPVEAIAEAFTEVLRTDGQAALQYSVTEGYRPLREWIARHSATRGLHTTADQVLITNGSQQGIDLVAKVLLDPGDCVVVEDPSYLAALQVFGGYEAQFETVASDDDGMRMDALEELLSRRRPKLIYIVPEFQNPKGTRLSLERRYQLVALAQRHGVPIFEDDPYGELRFRGPALPPLAALDESGLVIYASTFSKTLAPGLRIGWLVAPPAFLRSLTIAKQAADLHSSTLAQRAVAKLLERFDFQGHLARLRAIYGDRCQAMLDALGEHMPEETRWTRPEGGLFLWTELPGGLSGDTLLAEALKKHVAFVPGSPFFAREPQHAFIRLNFSNRSRAFIQEGIGRLGEVIRERLAA